VISWMLITLYIWVVNQYLAVGKYNNPLLQQLCIIKGLTKIHKWYFSCNPEVLEINQNHIITKRPLSKANKHNLVTACGIFAIGISPHQITVCVK